MKNTFLTKFIGFGLIITIALITHFFQNDQTDSPKANEQITRINKTDDNKDSSDYEVLEVIDGDTLRIAIDGKSEKVRLLQVNTPEVHQPQTPMGKTASDFTKNFLKNRRVRLEYDRETRDQYGRLLCYVFITDDAGEQLCLNEELVRNGMAKVVRYGKNTLRYDEYKALEKEAKAQNLGIWQDIKANYPKKQ